MNPAIRLRVWQFVDWWGHLLYEPTGLGRRGYRHRWHHNVHLLPGFVVSWICYKYDLALGLTQEEARS